MKIKLSLKTRRRKRIRAKIFGTAKRPRLSVFRSNKHIYAQIIDDQKQRTLVSASDLELKSAKTKNKTLIAFQVGQLLAKKANSKKIKQVIFDRGHFAYHGRVQSVAEGARKGGLQF